jgi:hypothetical protein
MSQRFQRGGTLGLPIASATVNAASFRPALGENACALRRPTQAGLMNARVHLAALWDDAPGVAQSLGVSGGKAGTSIEISGPASPTHSAHKEASDR